MYRKSTLKMINYYELLLLIIINHVYHHHHRHLHLHLQREASILF